NTTLILPMAGAGSRFSVKGYKNPKPLLDVSGKYMIVQAVNCLPKTNNKVFICLQQHIDDYDIKNILENEYTNCKVFSIDKITEG
ncbi:glycosyltransferase family 2 protein, partial [Enterobacter kobei]